MSPHTSEIGGFMKLTVTARELPALLDRAPSTTRYLSLDCFDTLLWRNVMAPRDVFADLPLAGGAIWPRAKAEARARRHGLFQRGKNEVPIEEIYRSLLPNADDEAIAAAVQAELDAEARHCYGFAPTVELMRAAKARGLEIVIVSDTYLSEAQLRTLIARAAGEDVVSLIDHVFVSSTHGLSKGEGLFKPVLKALKCGPEALFHVGDNLGADQTAPAMLGIATAHLKQFTDQCATRLRLEASAATVIDGRVRHSKPAHAPHRPVLSLFGEEDPVVALGHDVLGPVMHGFVSWVEAERREMAARVGRPVKLLFLMRDGHLPMLAHRALFGDADTAPVELSRFTARRASFSTETDVRNFLATEEQHGRPDVLGRQLGLNRIECDKISKGKTGAAAQEQFSRDVLDQKLVRKVIERSGAFAETLIGHLKRAGIERGDAVMFVDLGYAGTVQNLMEPVLRDRFDLAVAGRYLLLRDTVDAGYDKKGLFDVRNYDFAAVHALSMPIAVVEQMCTVSQGSVIDYAPDGAPIRKANDHKAAQNALRDRIQEACIAYMRNAEHAVVRPAASDDDASRRSMAAAVLARFLFMPTAEEIEVLGSFQHDVNLGTDDMVSLLDPELAGAGLKKRGLLYLNQANRMFLPGELHGHGFPHLLALFATSRFQFDLRATDFQVGKIEFQAFLADANSEVPLTLEAHATHDGFYQATVPIGAGRFAVGLPVGTIAEWIEIEEAAFHTIEGLNDPIAAMKSPAIPAQIIHEGMEQQAQNFFRCREDGLLLVPPPVLAAGRKEPLVFSFVFRPVVRRTPRALLQKAA